MWTPVSGGEWEQLTLSLGGYFDGHIRSDWLREGGAQAVRTGASALPEQATRQRRRVHRPAKNTHSAAANIYIPVESCRSHDVPVVAYLRGLHTCLPGNEGEDEGYSISRVMR